MEFPLSCWRVSWYVCLIRVICCWEFMGAFPCHVGSTIYVQVSRSPCSSLLSAPSSLMFPELRRERCIADRSIGTGHSRASCSLHFGQLRKIVLISIFCKRKTLWWGVRAVLTRLEGLHRQTWAICTSKCFKGKTVAYTFVSSSKDCSQLNGAR